MASFGYQLSSEEQAPADLVANGRRGEEAGFDFIAVSDHFHPWTDEQGESGFVWSMLGALAAQTERVGIGTAVVGPTVRLHPALVAQAAATVQLLSGGRFFLGVGTGEALNDHIFGDAWPRAKVRREMLEEAVAVMRLLWDGEQHSHDGRHYTVDRARIYSAPETPPPVIVSGFGPRSVALAERIGDGFMTVMPDAEAAARFEGRPRYGKLDVCWAATEEEARATALRTWPTTALPGELGQVLPTPAHFEQAASLVGEHALDASVALGPDPERHVAGVREFLDAGFDHVLIQQYGPDQEGFLRFYADEVLPALRA